MLGPLSVLCDDRPVSLPRKQRALLGLLAVQPDRTVSHEEIADVLWSGDAPLSYPQLVHTHVARLRRIIEPPSGEGATSRRICTVRGGYLFNSAGVRLDLRRFEDQVVLARRTVAHEPATALDLYGQALHCWQGRLLHDLPQLWHHPSVVRVAQRHIDVAIEFADLALQLNRSAFAVEHLRTASYEEPLHEPLQARIMLTLADSGRRAAALHLFAELRTRLKEELGVEPSEDIRQARAAVLRQGGAAERASPPGIPAPTAGTRLLDAPYRMTAAPEAHPEAAAPVRSPSMGMPAQLPPASAPFTGRQPQLAYLDSLLDPRHIRDGTLGLAVVHGPPDIGKSALAVRWAHQRLDEFPDGQLHACLQGSTDPALRTVTPGTVLTGFLRSLGVRDDWMPGSPEEATALFRSLLAGRRFLVMLDDVADVSQVRCLLPGTPGNAVIATSRSPLSDLVTREGALSVALDALTADEAHDLVVTHLGAERTAAEPGAVEELVEVCGRLPLPLRRAVTRLSAAPWRSFSSLVAEIAGGESGNVSNLYPLRSSAGSSRPAGQCRGPRETVPDMTADSLTPG